MPEEERRISPAVAIIPVGLGLAALIGIAALAWAAPPTPPPGKANLYGKVTDSVTGNPILDVLITLNSLEVYTNSAGNYAFADLDPGEYILRFEKEGYQTLIY